MSVAEEREFLSFRGVSSLARQFFRLVDESD